MNKKEWLEARKKGVGSSDSPVILKASPFKTPKELWAEKLGLIPEPESTPAMKRGEVLEDLVADLYADKTSRKLQRKKDILYHPNLSWMLANIDRQIVGESPGPAPLEIKCPGIRVFSRIKREGLPDYCIIQLQHQLAVTKRKWAAFAVFNSELWQLIHFDVEPDRELQDLIIEHDARFWEEHVLKQIPPEEEEIGVELPKVEGKLFKADALPEVVQMVEDLREARQLYEAAELAKKSAEDRIKIAMEEAQADILEANGCRVYYSWQKGRRNFDRTLLKKDHPEIDLDQYMIPGKPTRPFRPFWLKEREVE